MNQQRNNRLSSLQVLRAVAAIAVVAHHSFRATMVNSPPPSGSIFLPPSFLIQAGAAGVDIFFIISGFLMMYISEPYFDGRKSAQNFIAHRIIRIWPPYLIATLIACAIMAAKALHGPSRPFDAIRCHSMPFDAIRCHSMPFDLQPLRLASIFFVPSLNERGLLQPIIGPGWTLNYEMLFYVSFAVTIALGRPLALVKLTAIILALFIVGICSSNVVVNKFLGDPILFEFVIGAALGFALKTNRLNVKWPAIWIAMGLICAVMAGLLGFGVDQRLFAYGLPAALIFIGFYGLEDIVRWPRWVTTLGDASYSIYLIHILIIYRITSNQYLQHHGWSSISAVTLSILAVIVAVISGVAFYYVVERPMLRACTGLYNSLTRKHEKPPMVAQ